jgi:Holliday junction resolvasome RuvABC endonuclease subunit
MPINIYSVSNHLESEGWQLLSETYKNLDTELEMRCPEGHIQKQTYAKWRKRPICEQCIAGDPYKVKKNKVPLKKSGTRRILALDAATNVTGYAIYDNDTLVSYGIYKADATKELTERINEIKKWLRAMIEEHEIDFIGIENIQLQNYSTNSHQLQVKTYNALARLQGVLLDTCFEASVDSDLVYSTEWRKYCGIGEGTGRENKKKQAQDKVRLWYGLDCTQDEADAICIGKYFVGLLKKEKSSWGEKI